MIFSSVNLNIKVFSLIIKYLENGKWINVAKYYFIVDKSIKFQDSHVTIATLSFGILTE